VPVVQTRHGPAHECHTPRRRRLWELPEAAHELLLGLGFPPDTLRAHVAHALGRVKGCHYRLQGSDADVLFSAIRDLGQRNPLAEALQQRLDERHVLALQRWARLREPDALRAAWLQALASGEVAAALWALLTHRLGAELQADALVEARAWLLERARRSVVQAAQDASQHAALDAARAQAAGLQLRLQKQQADGAAALDTLRRELAAALGEAARLRAQPRQPAPPAPRMESETPPRPAAAVAATPAPPCAAPAPAPSATAAAALPVVQGRHVLCVGGVKRAVARYRAHVEHLGGRFVHHDGGAEDGVQRLQGHLQRADLVLCQAGCINHEAYQRIKHFCARSGKPCIYLPRPSLSHFERALQQLATPGQPRSPA
jgi:Uncharacterized protein conserved in bacteria (DUF2325)